MAKKPAPKTVKKDEAKPNAGQPNAAEPTLETKAPQPEEAPAKAEPAKAAAPVDERTQLAIEKVKEDAKRAVESILGGNPAATLGAPSGNVEDRTEQVQRDHIPGKLRKDKTYVPDRVYDENMGIDRACLLRNIYKYTMVPQEDFLNYRSMGFKMCLYDGGNQSGLADRGFLGTGDAVFTRTVRGYCNRGDVFLMYIPIRGWEALKQEDQEAIEREMPRRLGGFANAGYHEGIRTHIEVNGERFT